MWESIAFAILAAVAYVIHVVSQLHNFRQQPVKTVRRVWRSPGTAVKVTGNVVEVDYATGAQTMGLDSARGLWHSSPWAIQVIDNQLLGLVLFDETGRGMRIPGWHIRKGLGEASGAMVMERTDALVDELRAAHPDWRPKRVRGFLIYRLLLTASVAFWVLGVLPVALEFCHNLQGWQESSGTAATLIATVLLIPLIRSIWRAIVRLQLSRGKEAFAMPESEAA